MTLTHSLTHLLRDPAAASADAFAATPGTIARRAALEPVSAASEPRALVSLGGTGGALGATVSLAQPVKRHRGPTECCWGARQCPNCPRRRA
jgi:hypothetical protein